MEALQKEEEEVQRIIEEGKNPKSKRGQNSSRGKAKEEPKDDKKEAEKQKKAKEAQKKIEDAKQKEEKIRKEYEEEQKQEKARKTKSISETEA